MWGTMSWIAVKALIRTGGRALMTLALRSSGLSGIMRSSRSIR